MKSFRLLGLYMIIGLAFLAGYGFRSALAQRNADAGQRAEALPPDVLPESLARVPWATRDEFTSDEEKQAFDRVVKLHHVGGTMGPTPLRLHMPVVAEGYDIAINYLRFKAGLEPRYVQLAVLVSSREFTSKYQWIEHERNSVKDLPRDVLEVVRNKRPTSGLNAKDAALIQFGRELYRQPIVSSKTYAEMERLFGRRATLGATLLMAHYTANELLLRAYNQHVAPGEKSPFPNP
jgi:hypothetical protein